MAGGRCHKIQINDRNHPEVLVFAATKPSWVCVVWRDVPAPSLDAQPLEAERACTGCQLAGDLQLHNGMEHKFKSWYYLWRWHWNYSTPYQFITCRLLKRSSWTLRALPVKRRCALHSGQLSCVSDLNCHPVQCKIVPCTAVVLASCSDFSKTRESLQLSQYSGSSSAGSLPATSIRRSPSRKSAPEPVAGAPAQLQEQPPALPRNEKGKEVHFLRWAHILTMGHGGLLLTYAALDYTQAGLGVAGDCLQSQTTKQERFTGGWQQQLHLLMLPRDQTLTSQMLTLRGFSQSQCFEVFFPELFWKTKIHFECCVVIAASGPAVGCASVSE